MYTNVGGKIKGLAKAIAWIGTILSIIYGVSVIGLTGTLSYNAGPTAGFLTGGGVLMGILIIVVGSILSRLISLVLYGFGELVDNSGQMRQELQRLSDLQFFHGERIRVD